MLNCNFCSDVGSNYSISNFSVEIGGICLACCNGLKSWMGMVFSHGPNVELNHFSREKWEEIQSKYSKEAKNYV